MPDLGDGLRCGSCQEDIPPRSRFCLACGTPVADRSETEARKTVTLVFCDVSGSTALGEELDPEAYRGVMSRYFDVARGAVERHGGQVPPYTETMAYVPRVMKFYRLLDQPRPTLARQS